MQNQMLWTEPRHGNPCESLLESHVSVYWITGGWLDFEINGVE